MIKTIVNAKSSSAAKKLNQKAMKATKDPINSMKASIYLSKMKRMIKFLMALSVCFMSTIIFATNWYVRSGANGAKDGTDWNRAWADTADILWGVTHVKAGDSVWIAGGTYSKLNVQASGTSSSPIYIARVRATNSTPALAPGWNATNDAQVIINGSNSGSINSVTVYDCNYIVLDGQVPYSGILITNSTPGTTLLDYDNSGTSYCTNMNLDIGGACNGTITEPNETDCFVGVGGQSNNCLRFCQFHNAPDLLKAQSQTNLLIEHCKLFSNVTSDSHAHHPNVFQTAASSNVVFRYNEIYNWSDEGIMLDNNSGQLPCVNWYIYDNLWHDSISNGVLAGSARIIETQVTTNGPVYLYNNTFANIYTGITYANNGPGQIGGWTNCINENNIFINVGGSAAQSFTGQPGGGCTDDYNLTDQSTVVGSHSISGSSACIFVDYDSQSYGIVGTNSSAYPAGKGANLGSPYNVDYNGNTEPASWDIGAVSYQPLLIDVQFGDSGNPFVKIGEEVTGATTNDYWNFVSCSKSGATFDLNPATDVNRRPQVRIQGDTGGGGSDIITESVSYSSDNLFNGYAYSGQGEDFYIYIDLPPGSYTLYLYNNNASHYSTTFKLTLDGNDLGSQSTDSGHVEFDGVTVTKLCGDTLTIDCSSGTQPICNGLQIHQVSP